MKNKAEQMLLLVLKATTKTNSNNTCEIRNVTIETCKSIKRKLMPVATLARVLVIRNVASVKVGATTPTITTLLNVLLVVELVVLFVEIVMAPASNILVD
jgi:hypothetical protein